MSYAEQMDKWREEEALAEFHAEREQMLQYKHDNYEEERFEIAKIGGRPVSDILENFEKNNDAFFAMSKDLYNECFRLMAISNSNYITLGDISGDSDDASITKDVTKTDFDFVYMTKAQSSFYNFGYVTVNGSYLREEKENSNMALEFLVRKEKCHFIARFIKNMESAMGVEWKGMENDNSPIREFLKKYGVKKQKDVADISVDPYSRPVTKTKQR